MMRHFRTPSLLVMGLVPFCGALEFTQDSRRDQIQEFPVLLVRSSIPASNLFRFSSTVLFQFPKIILQFLKVSFVNKVYGLAHLRIKIKHMRVSETQHISDSSMLDASNLGIQLRKRLYKIRFRSRS